MTVYAHFKFRKHLHQAGQFHNPDSFYQLIPISTIRFKKRLKEGLEFFIFQHPEADIRKGTASQAQYPCDRVDTIYHSAEIVYCEVA